MLRPEDVLKQLYLAAVYPEGSRLNARLTPGTPEASAGRPVEHSEGPSFIMSSQTIAVHLPDGAIREVPVGTTPLDIANSISPRLAAVSVVARLTPIAST